MFIEQYPFKKCFNPLSAFKISNSYKSPKAHAISVTYFVD